MCQQAKRTSRAGSPLSKNYIGTELHAIKSLQKIKKKDEILSRRRVRSLVQKSIPGDTEGPVVGTYLKGLPRSRLTHYRTVTDVVCTVSQSDMPYVVTNTYNKH